VLLRPIARVYAPLADHLAARGAVGERRVTRGYRPWWRGQASAPHAWYGWLHVGWGVEAVDRAAETVTFARPGGLAGRATGGPGWARPRAVGGVGGGVVVRTPL
jgi:hypothetical protein